MTSNAKSFIDCLIDADKLLDEYSPSGFKSSDNKVSLSKFEKFDLAIFEEWSEFSEPKTPEKPIVRIIQHLSCTGGTLFSRCLAAMPNTFLLSEANPLSSLSDVHRSGFAPSDLTYLTKHSGFPLIDELSQKIFKADINIISKHIRQLGGYLVIRGHPHSDYLIGAPPRDLCTISALLENEFQVLSALTIRQPVDSYLSLVNQGWLHFNPATFDEYCTRYLLFIRDNQNIPLYKYENFVDNPEEEMGNICKTLKLPYNENFLDVFDLNILSGDSGRTSAYIAKRKRRDYRDSFQDEINTSKHYRKLCQQLNYRSLAT